MFELQAAETGQRGYLLTADERYLQSYYGARPAIRQYMATLQKINSSNSGQQRRLHSMQLLIAEKLNELDRTINLRRGRKPLSALQIVESEEGRLRMQDIIGIGGEVRTHALGLIESRDRDRGRVSRIACLLLLSTFALAFFIARRMLARELRAREEAEHQVGRRSAELKAIFDSIPDAIYFGDANGISRCNDIALTSLGFRNMEELRQNGITLAERIRARFADSGDRIPPGQEPFEQALAGHSCTREVIGRTIGADQDRIFRCAAAPVRLNGKIIGAVSVNTDITESKKAEAASSAREMAAKRELARKVQSTRKALDRTRKDLRRLAASLIDSQEQERRRIARDLHDDFGQRLALLEIKGQQLIHARTAENQNGHSSWESWQRDAARLSKDITSFARQLHPSILDNLGLPVALESLAEEFGTGRSEAVTVLTRGVPETMPSEVSTALYRIAQEALRNVAKHGGDVPVRIFLSGTTNDVRLTIRDYGMGFDPAVATLKKGLGLISMEERTRLIGGRLRIHSFPKMGTLLRVTVPVEWREPES